MASECAVLGVPAIYAAHTGRGYTNDEEKRYGLVTNVRIPNALDIIAAMERILEKSPEDRERQRRQLLSDTIDVAAFAANCIESFPEPLIAYHRQMQH